MAFMASVHAATLAQFDIDVEAPPTDTQTGFLGMTGTSGTDGGITLTITGIGLNETRDRGTNGITPPNPRTPVGTGFEALCTDFRFARSTETANFTVSGLTASTDYILRIWSWDDATTGTVTTNWYQTSIAPGNLVGTHTMVQNNGTLEDLYVDVTVRSDGLGNVDIIGQTASSALIFLNGLEVMTIPEPSAISLMGLGFGALLLRRRRS